MYILKKNNVMKLPSNLINSSEYLVYPFKNILSAQFRTSADAI